MRKFVIFDTVDGRQVGVQPAHVRAVEERPDGRVMIVYGDHEESVATVAGPVTDVIEMLEAKD